MKRPFILAVLALGLLSGCTLIPDEPHPDLPVSQSWPQGPAYPETQGRVNGTSPLLSDIAWQTFFSDPRLKRLIQTALDNNRDLRVAILNIEASRASLGETQSDLLPHVTAGASESASRTPADLTSAIPPRPVTSRSYAAKLSVTSFEVDLFGRLRSLEKQAQENLLSTESAAITTRISLIAEVANDYLTLLGDQKLLALTEDTLKSREDSLALIRHAFEKGIDSEVDVAQARTAVETARASRAAYIRQVAQDRNALRLLLGASLDESLLAADLDEMRFIEDVPVGLPSEVLLHRPDIAQAEHTLLAANANIGAVRAAFFPSITLTGSAGTASARLTNLFQPGTGSWNFGPSISMPLFDAGLTQAQLEAAKATRDIDIAQYEKSVQTAFREVSDALAAKGTYTDQITAQAALVDASQDSFRLSKARYEHGIDSYLSVLDSQRSLFSAQQTLVSLRVSRLSNLVTLYKVLGGGQG
jgi:multidrug efflux system outer membrane protein